MHTDEILDFIKTKLSKERYEHSIGVATLSKELAKTYGTDQHKAEIAGLLHDCAKELNDEKTKELLGRISNLDISILRNQKLWHGPAGAELSKENFNIEDDIYDAIFYHTIGKEDISLLTKIIFLADAVEINRDREFSWSRGLRKLAFDDLDMAVMKVIENNIISVIQRGLTIHPSSVLIRNSIINKREASKWMKI